MFFLLFRWFRRLVYLCLLVAFVYLVVTSVQVLVASHEASGLPTIGRDPVIVVIGSPTTATISPDLEQRCALAKATSKHTYTRRRNHLNNKKNMSCLLC